MERLTKKSEIFGDITFRGDGCTLDQVKQRLFDYEEAEEQLIKAAGVDLQSMVGEFMHYYTLQKEGRLVELPCKVGDVVYRLGYSICHLGETFGDSSACLRCLEECTSERVVQRFIIPDIEWIIKHKDDLTQRNVNVFWYLTCEEAEDALKRRCL